MVIIDGYQIDAATLEAPTFSAEVSEFPIEGGSDVADHVRNLPIELRVEGVVTDTPIGVLAVQRSILDLPTEDFLARMEAIRKARQPITVETSRRVYSNMILKTFEAPVDNKTGDAVSFSATFHQIEIVSTSRFEINVELPRAKPRKSFGARAPIPYGTPEHGEPPALYGPELYPNVSPLG